MVREGVHHGAPPSRGRSGKTWPGRLKSDATLLGSARARNVAARSAAEIPVVVPACDETRCEDYVAAGTWAGSEPQLCAP